MTKILLNCLLSIGYRFMDRHTFTCSAMDYTTDLFLKWRSYIQEVGSVEDSANVSKNDNYFIQFIYDYYADDLLSYGMRMGYQKEVLEDAIHDLFYKLCRSPHLVKQVKELKLYLFRALKNRLVNIQKSTAKYVTTDFPEFKLAVNTDSLHRLIEEEEQMIIKERINKLLGELSNRQREIIYLRFLQEMTYAEIGELLEMTPASVKNVVYRAINKIRK